MKGFFLKALIVSLGFKHCITDVPVYFDCWNCLWTKPDYINIFLKTLKGIKMVKLFPHIKVIHI